MLCFALDQCTEPVTPRYRGNPVTTFRELNNTTPYKVRAATGVPQGIDCIYTSMCMHVAYARMYNRKLLCYVY